MINPVEKLCVKMAIAWCIFIIVGASLIVWGEGQLSLNTGKALLCMSAGYLAFGQGLKR